jgi:hypothetical protein
VRTFRIEGWEREFEGCRGECREGRLVVSGKAGGDIEGGDCTDGDRYVVWRGRGAGIILDISNLTYRPRYSMSVTTSLS